MTKIFKLPDLGEGLPDAEIHEWFIKEGEAVKTDQPMVAMETAKAVVDVPSPRDGVIAKLHGKVGDIIKTGAPLVEFVDGEDSPFGATAAGTKKSDVAATVVGAITANNSVLVESAMGVKIKRSNDTNANAIPAVRALAEKLGINILALKGSGIDGKVTAHDVLMAKKSGQAKQSAAPTKLTGEPLRGVRRIMANVMAQSHAEVVPVTIMDDADIHAWPEKTDITARVIRAIIAGCKVQPALNAWFNGKKMARLLHSEIHLGIAMDSEDGLFVPVLKNVENTTPLDWRNQIESFKQQVKARDIPPEALQGATIMLSNFGIFAARYANPIIVPPCVAIIGTGKIREMGVAYNGQLLLHKILPLSITVDHRVVTGGEVTRFLAAMIEDLRHKS